MGTIFDFNGSGRLGREIYFYQGADAVKNKERGGAEEGEITTTVHSNCKSNIVGSINDRELLALARINKAPALQATMYSHY